MYAKKKKKRSHEFWSDRYVHVTQAWIGYVSDLGPHAKETQIRLEKIGCVRALSFEKDQTWDALREKKIWFESFLSIYIYSFFSLTHTHVTFLQSYSYRTRLQKCGNVFYCIIRLYFLLTFPNQKHTVKWNEVPHKQIIHLCLTHMLQLLSGKFQTAVSNLLYRDDMPVQDPIRCTYPFLPSRMNPFSRFISQNQASGKQQLQVVIKPQQVEAKTQT